MLTTLKNKWKLFWQEEDGLGTLEMLLIIVVILIIALLFKNQIMGLVNKLLNTINTKSDEFLN